MATCENCLHYEVCKPMGLAMRNAMKAGSLTECVEHNCYIKCFKPTADVVEVVRCKDCRQTLPGESITGDEFCVLHDVAVPKDYYCASGERKDAK